MPKNGFSLSFILIIIAIFSGVFFAITHNSKGSLPQVQKPVPTSSNLNSNDPDAIISQLQQYLKENTQYNFENNNGYNFLWWITDDNWNIYDQNAPTARVKLIVEEKDYNTSAKLQEANELNKTISDILVKNGFTKNIKNSSTSVNDDKFYDYVQAFEKEKTKCTVSTDPDISGLSEKDKMGHHVTISCSDRVDDLYKQQLPYLKGIKDGRRLAITNIIRSGDFANVSVNGRRSGYYVVGKFENGNFVQIYIGQDYHHCDEVDKNKIPKEIYQNCYEGSEPNFKLRFPTRQ